MPDVNIPLLRKAVEWAEAEAAKPPELCEWEQGEYVIRPSDRAKYASKANVHSLINPQFAARIASKSPDCGTCYCIAGYVSAATSGDTVSGPAAEEVATEALGLDLDSASDLFCANNTIEDVRRIAEEIAGERL